MIQLMATPRNVLMPLGQTGRAWTDMAALGSDVYACVYGGDIYKQTGGTGPFVATGQTSRNWTALGALGGNMYAAVDNGDIYMQTGGSGAFAPLSQTARGWYRLVAMGSDMYAFVYNGGQYKQTAGAGNFVAVAGVTSRAWNGAAAIGTTIYAVVRGGQLYSQANGAGDFALVAGAQSNLNWRGLAARGADLFGIVDAGSLWKFPSATCPAQLVAQTPRAYRALANLAGDLYAPVNASDIYMMRGRSTVATTTQMLPPTAPLMVDTTDFFRGAISGVPDGIANFASTFTGDGRLTVTGVAGGSALTIDEVGIGSLSDYSGTWAIVVKHDDGSYGVHTATGLAGSQLTVYPTLAKAVTRGRAGNLYCEYNGQHLTEIGHFALAKHMVSRQRYEAYIAKYVSRSVFDVARAFSGATFTAVGGLTNDGPIPDAGFSHGLFYDGVSNIFDSPGELYSGAGRSATFGSIPYVRIGAVTAGEGVSQTVALGGATGAMEMVIAVTGQKSGVQGSPVRVVVVVDGVTKLDVQVEGVRRLCVPYTAATSATVTATIINSAVTLFRISDLCWFYWTTEIPDGARPIFHQGSKICVLCDSWGVYQNGAFARGLQAELPNCDIVNVSSAGKDAQWALANYDSLVPADAEYVVMDFVINDANGGRTSAQWVSDVAALCAHAFTQGQCPVYLRCMATGSASQTQNLTVYQSDLLYTMPTT